MCDPISATVAVIAAGASTYQAQQQQAAQASMDQYQSEVASNNAAIDQQQAANAENQGQLALQQQQIKNTAAQSSQRATMAANGLDLNSGSPLEIQDSDQTLGNLDAASIQNNTINQVYGDDAGAMNQQAQSQADQFKSELSNWNETNSLMNAGISTGASPVSNGIQYLAALG